MAHLESEEEDVPMEPDLPYQDQIDEFKDRIKAGMSTINLERQRLDFNVGIYYELVMLRAYFRRWLDEIERIKLLAIAYFNRWLAEANRRLNR